MDVDPPGSAANSTKTAANSDTTTLAIAELSSIGVADGSARYDQEGCSIQAAVWGPLPVKAKNERPEGATLTVTVEPLGCPPGLVHNSLAVRLQTLLELSILGASYPRSLIHVAIQPVRLSSSIGENDSFVACFNAAVLALMDAAIPMAFVPVAVREASLEAVYIHRTRGVELLHLGSTDGLSLGDCHAQLARLEELSRLEFARIQELFHRHLKNS